MSIRSIIGTVAIAAFFSLTFYSYALYQDNKASKLVERSLIAKLGTASMLISVQSYIDESNRAISASQLANEKRLLNESDTNLRRLKTATAGNWCAGERIPDSILSILRE